MTDIDLVSIVNANGPAVDGPFGTIDNIDHAVAALRMLQGLSDDDLFKVIERAAAIVDNEPVIEDEYTVYQVGTNLVTFEARAATRF